MTDEAPPPIEIPLAELSDGALRGVIESFVLREGTEYGARDYSLDEKVGHVLSQLQRGEARIVFDPEAHSVTILPVTASATRAKPQREAPP